MWTWLANLLTGGLADKALQAYVASKQTGAEIDRAAIAAAIEQAKADADVIKAEQGNRLTRALRPHLALPFVAYLWKLVIWDKIFGLGSTDPLSPELWNVMMTVVGAYMGGRSLERIAQIWRGR